MTLNDLMFTIIIGFLWLADSTTQDLALPFLCSLLYLGAQKIAAQQVRIPLNHGSNALNQPFKGQFRPKTNLTVSLIKFPT